MPASTKIFIQLEINVNYGKIPQVREWVEKNRELNKDMGSEFWQPSINGERIIHNECFPNANAWKKHFHEWFVHNRDEVMSLLTVEKYQVCGPVNQEMKNDLAWFGVPVEYYDHI